MNSLSMSFCMCKIRLEILTSYTFYNWGIHMNLQSGTYYWPTTFPDPPSYPSLEEDLSCDVLIIGGGSSGAQCAYYACRYSIRCSCH